MLEEEIRSASARGNLEDVTSLLKRGAKVAPDSVWIYFIDLRKMYF